MPLDGEEIRADQFDRIEEIARDTGQSRSAVIQLLLDLGIVQLGAGSEASQ